MWFFGKKEKKTITTTQSEGLPSYSKINEKAYINEAYEKNIIGFACVDRISSDVASVPLRVRVNGEEVKNHALLDLLKNPNPNNASATGTLLKKTLIAFKEICGNAYLNIDTSEMFNKEPLRLQVLPSDKIIIKTNDDINPSSYEYNTINGKQINYRADDNLIMHLKSVSLTNSLYGMSPITAGAISIDTHNMSKEWNANLLENSCVPSGDYNSEELLSDANYKKLKDGIKDYQGYANVGKPMLTEGKITWNPKSLSPTDMDFLNGLNLNSRDICKAFKIPPQIIGIEGDSTYKNYETALEAYWEDTVIPKTRELVEALNIFLSHRYADSPELFFHEQDLIALENKRERKWNAIQNSTFLTINEKRKAVGYATINEDKPKDVHNQILVPSGLLPLDFDNSFEEE